MTYTFGDVLGFAGGFACGATLAGHKIIAKREHSASFGAPLMEANRAFLGDGWLTQASPADQWEVVKSDIVIGNPPCSGFSNFSAGTSIGIGANSPINECMWDMMRYAARVRPAVVVMESVAQAFSKGQVLMHALSQELCKRSGLAYRTTHVIQDNYSTGGCTLRRRYFLVNSLVPFGVEEHQFTWLPMVNDALGDLRRLPITWDAQQYDARPTWWSRELRSATGTVDGHDVLPVPNMARLAALQRDDVRWEPGDRESEMLKKYYDAFGELPEEYRYQSHAGHTRHLTRDKHLIDRGLETGGFGQTKYWPWDKPGRVITGHGPYQVRHPDNRPLTHRETARILGFPDDWLCGTSELRRTKSMHQYWGKGTSVHPATWVMTWVRESLDGNPGANQGVLLPDGSHFIDISASWKDAARRFGLAEHLGVPLKKPGTPRLPSSPLIEDLEDEDEVDEELEAAVEAALEDVTIEEPDVVNLPDLPEPAEAVVTCPDVAAPVIVTTGDSGSKRYPGWAYDRNPAKGPVWPTEVLDRLVMIAEGQAGGESARPGMVAEILNSPGFRQVNRAEEYRGAASYHVTQSRARRSAEVAR